MTRRNDMKKVYVSEGMGKFIAGVGKKLATDAVRGGGKTYKAVKAARKKPFSKQVVDDASDLMSFTAGAGTVAAGIAKMHDENNDMQSPKNRPSYSYRPPMEPERGREVSESARKRVVNLTEKKSMMIGMLMFRPK